MISSIPILKAALVISAIYRPFICLQNYWDIQTIYPDSRALSEPNVVSYIRRLCFPFRACATPPPNYECHKAQHQPTPPESFLAPLANKNLWTCNTVSNTSSTQYSNPRIPITILNFSAKKFDRLKIGSLSMWCELNSDIYRVAIPYYQNNVFAAAWLHKLFRLQNLKIASDDLVHFTLCTF